MGTKIKLKKITFYNRGYENLLTSDEVGDLIADETIKIQANTHSKNFTSDIEIHKYATDYSAGKRWLGFVSSKNKKGAIEETEHKKLSKAVTLSKAVKS